MEKRLFGKTGMQVSPLGFGGAEIGFQNVDIKTIEKLLLDALDAGLNVIDTAECYGKSEELIGKALGNKRSQYYLFTKCGHDPSSWEIGAWQSKQIIASIDYSLKRLRTDYLDLIQLHSCPAETLQQGEVIEALQKAKQAGKTRFIGYSGDTKDALYAVNTDVFDTLQTSINIADQECIELTLPLAQAKNMGVIAKRPIANAAWASKNKPANDYAVPYWERLNKLAYSFLNGNRDQAAEIALRFTLSVPGVHTAIVGTTKPGRWRENALHLEKGQLSTQEYEAIRQAWKANAQADWVGRV